MTHHFLCLILILAAFSAVSFAQTSDDYNRFEVYGGYLNGQNKYTAKNDIVDFGVGPKQTVNLCNGEGAAAFGKDFSRLFCDRRSFNGFNAAATFNLSRFIGVTGDFSAQFRKDTYVDTLGPNHTDTTKVNDKKYGVYGGIQVKDNSAKTRVKPFGHAMAGFVSERITGNGTSTNPGEGNTVFHDNPTSFSLKVGGGLDVRLSKRIDLRVIEFDYVPIFARTRVLDCNCGFGVMPTSKRADNFTFGIGVVIH